MELLDGINVHFLCTLFRILFRDSKRFHSLQGVFCVNCTRMSQEDRDEFDIASGSALGSELRYQVFMLCVACLKLVSRRCVSAIVVCIF